jgi:hypothetical protein
MKNASDQTNYRIGDVVIYTNSNTNTEHEHTIEDVRKTSNGKTIYKLSNCGIMFGAEKLKIK